VIEVIAINPALKSQQTTVFSGDCYSLNVSSVYNVVSTHQLAAEKIYLPSFICEFLVLSVVHLIIQRGSTAVAANIDILLKDF
jgi:hypothetical protein